MIVNYFVKIGERDIATKAKSMQFYAMEWQNGRHNNLIFTIYRKEISVLVTTLDLLNVCVEIALASQM